MDYDILDNNSFVLEFDFPICGDEGLLHVSQGFLFLLTLKSLILSTS